VAAAAASALVSMACVDKSCCCCDPAHAEGDDASGGKGVREAGTDTPSARGRNLGVKVNDETRLCAVPVPRGTFKRDCAPLASRDFAGSWVTHRKSSVVYRVS